MLANLIKLLSKKILNVKLTHYNSPLDFTVYLMYEIDFRSHFLISNLATIYHLYTSYSN